MREGLGQAISLHIIRHMGSGHPGLFAAAAHRYVDGACAQHRHIHSCISESDGLRDAAADRCQHPFDRCALICARHTKIDSASSPLPPRCLPGIIWRLQDKADLAGIIPIQTYAPDHVREDLIYALACLSFALLIETDHWIALFPKARHCAAESACP